MAGDWMRLLLATWFVLAAVGGTTAAPSLCPRMTLEGVTETTAVWVQFGLGGVWDLQDYQHNGMPVYKMANIFFFYDEPYRRFGMGLEVGKTIFMGTTQSSSFDKNTWLRQAHSKYPFDRAIGTWFNIIFSPTTKKSILRTLSGNIRFRCVDRDYVICESRKLAFDEALYQKTNEGTIIYTNIPGQDYYEQLPNVFNENRPVFESRNGSLTFRLYYKSYWKGWVVGNEYPTTNVFMIVKDNAWSPEYITNGWTYFTEGKLRNINAKLNCLGVSDLEGKLCSTSNTICQNNGTCYEVAKGKEVCICADGFNGATCENIKPKCPPTNTMQDYRDIISDGNYVGSVGTFLCREGHEPEYFFGVCEADSATTASGHWKKSQECSLVTTTTPRPTTPRPRWTRRTTTLSANERFLKRLEEDMWRNNQRLRERLRRERERERERRRTRWIYDTTIAVGLIVPFVLPGIIWYILYKISDRLDYKYNKFKLKQMEAQTNTLSVKAIRLKEDLDKGRITTEEHEEKFAEVLKIHEATVERDKEVRQEMKAKRKIKNISFARIYSMAFSLGLWVWVPVLIVYCEIEFESARLTWLFEGLYPCAVTLIVIGYLWVLIESLCSREYGYLKKLGDGDYASNYLKTLRETAPHIMMKAECYHWETRTRTVTYTDANGNLNTRLETYQERVVTHRDAELFRYGYWVDTSNEKLQYNETYGVTKIKLKNKIIPGDIETRDALNEAQEAFKARNEGYDLYMDYELDVSIEGFQKRMAAYTDPSKKSWWIKKRYFWLATLLTYTWPYRWLFRARTGRAKYKLEKHLYMRRPEDAADSRASIVAYDISSEQQAELMRDKGEEDKEEKPEGKSRWGSKRKSKSSMKDKDKNKDKGPSYKPGKEVTLELGRTRVNSY